MFRFKQHRDGQNRWELGLRFPSSRPGMTLIELLVVVVILVTLVAVTLPMMRPALEGREMREAARQINAFLGAAQARATARGRPVGVMFHRRADDLGASFQMSIAEVPPPYSGDSVYSRAYSNAGIVGNYQAVLTNSPQAVFQVSPGVTFVARGDFIKFGYRGVSYHIDAVSPSGNDVLVVFSPPSLSAGPPALLPKINPVTGQENPGLEFQIYRKPQRSAAAPLELPTPAVIDWAYSGVGADGAGLIGSQANTNPNLDNPIIITFSPSGRVDRVFLDGMSETPLGTLYLLVGRVDQVGLLNGQNSMTNPPGSTTTVQDARAPMANLQDPKSLWVSVGQRSGLINTSPNNTSASDDDRLSANADPIVIAREFALRAQSMGGR